LWDHGLVTGTGDGGAIWTDRGAEQTHSLNAWLISPHDLDLPRAAAEGWMAARGLSRSPYV
jgi:hypothetical protein